MIYKNIKNFQIRKKGYTLILSLDRPPVNAMNEEVFTELHKLVENVNTDPNIITVIITSALTKVFTVGADVKELLKKYGSKRKLKNAINNLDLVHETYKLIESSPKPFIVAFRGLSYGGGIELGCTCDIRIASRDAVFAMPETRIAFIPGYGGTQRLPRLIGSGAAKKFIFSGEPMNAITALKVGLVDEITPKNKELDLAIKIAESIAKGSPRSTAFAKRAINEGRNLSLEEALEKEKEFFIKNLNTKECYEGVFAFIKKREPNFKRVGNQHPEKI
ncbi:MAG: enoyl-CoA hydratase/isomerase family protein [Candidatus Lokiarchaeota archaeon]|nr:enoyl-CoA hydratase/isomerase family protein [Candidatus Lokiarchaeota archaeon]